MAKTKRISTPRDDSDNHFVSDRTLSGIVQEEILRLRIANLKEMGESKESRIWKFLNSSFGLFLLSAILLSGLGRLYTDYTEDSRERQVRRLEALKVAMEIDYRMTQAETFMRSIEALGSSENDRKSASLFLWRVVVGDEMFQPSLPEFKLVHWFGLVSRLQFLGVQERPRSWWQWWKGSEVPRMNAITKEAFSAITVLENSIALDGSCDPAIVKENLAKLRLYRDTLMARLNP
jgi:hypothetical protein